MPKRASAPTLQLAAVFVVWGIAVALVGTSGEFPLSDDWAYAHVVRSLCEGRGFDLLPWTGASLVLQALYGAAACKLAGFSHEVLRTTTLVLSAVGIAAFHALLRALGSGRGAAAMGAAVLAFCPLWFNLSFTFMTDVPFAALAIAATWLYVRALSQPAGIRPSRSSLMLAGAVAAAAFLIRQHALSIAVAAAVALLWPAADAAADGRDHARAPSSGRGDAAPFPSRLVDAAIALALPVAAAAAYFVWAATAEDVPLAVHNKLGEAVTTSPLAMLNAAFRAIATLGLLFTPWALMTTVREGAERRIFAGTLAAALTVLGATALFLFVREGAAMFYLTNVLGDSGVGAVTTRDVLFLSPQAGPASAGSAAARALLTAVSLASAAALLTHLAAATPRLLRTTARPALFCVLALALSGLGTLAQAHYYFDRYLLVLLPLAIASVVAVSPAARPSWAAGTALAALGVYAVAGTHDYMEWNRARWEMLAILESAGVVPERIDGGVEYNAQRLAAKLRTAPNDAQARSGQDDSAKSWWWVVDDEWIVAFRPLDGYVEVDSRKFVRWLPPGEDRVLTLRREGWPSCDDGDDDDANHPSRDGAHDGARQDILGCAPTDPR